MKNKEIVLKKVIQKAIDEGWNIFGLKKVLIKFEIIEQDYFDDSLAVRFYCADGEVEVDLEKIIFNPDFAKAFFGEEVIFIKTHKIKILTEAKGDAEKLHRSKHTTPIFTWLYHLSKLALAENRLAYLEGFL